LSSMSHIAFPGSPSNIREMQAFPMCMKIPPVLVFAAGLRGTPTCTGVTCDSASALTVKRCSGWANVQLPAYFSVFTDSKPQGWKMFHVLLHNRQGRSQLRLLSRSEECDHRTYFRSLFLCFFYCSRWIFIKVNASFRMKLLSLLRQLFQ